MAKKSVGEILIEMGALDELQLQSALGHLDQWGGGLAKALLEKRFCSREDILRALSIQTGLPVIRLDGEPLDPKLVSVVPAKAAESLKVIPLRLEGRRGEVLVIAAAAPCSMSTLDEIRAVSRKQRVSAFIAHDDEVERAIGKLYYGREPPPSGQPSEPLALPVSIANEAEIDLTGGESLESAAVPVRPVRMFGWHQASTRALKMMIERGGIPAVPTSDEQLVALNPEDVLIASTLALQVALPSGTRLAGKLIVCGVQDGSDVEDARALGARMYLRPPFSTEQLVQAVAKVRPAR